MAHMTEKKRMWLHDKEGKPLDVPVRSALPVTAKRVRYQEFKEETLLLKKGSIRMKGAMPLSCDILLERNVPIILRDGVKIYANVFRPVDDEMHPTVFSCSPYGKEIDICIWPMGLFFKKGESLRLSISAFKTTAPGGPMSLIFGHAKVRVPKEGFTYMPGSNVKMVTLGGGSTKVAPDAVEIGVPQDVNYGRHAIYAGGKYESYLYVPVIPNEKFS